MGQKRIFYYPDARGKTPALEFLLGLGQADQEKMFSYVGYLEERGEELRRPIAEYLGDKLYELRPKQVRILYAFVEQRYAVILHAFRKKTGPVPPSDKRLAQARLDDFLQRYKKGLITIKG